MYMTEKKQQLMVSGTELFIKCLVNEKVDAIFSSENFVNRQLLSVLHECEQLKYVSLQHEQAAVHAADGYARATGKPGVVFIPAKSGITKAVTGIATAHMDSVPLIVFAFQEITHDETGKMDINGVTLPIAKHFFQMTALSELPQIVEEAFIVACDGRPGPVIVEISGELANTEASGRMKDREEQICLKKTEKHVFSARLLAQVQQEIQKAKKPVLFIGGGVNLSDSGELAVKLAEKAQIPVVSSLMGLGSIPSQHPLFLGMLGMHGTFAANKAVHQADLLICLGVRFSDRVTGRVNGFSPKSKKIQVDIDPAEINKIVPVDIPITGDVHHFLSQLQDMGTEANHSDWVTDAASWKRTAPGIGDSKSLLKPQEILQLLNNFTNDVSVVATDVGQHQMWTAIYYQFQEPRTFLTSGGLGTMGYGLPAAIGAALANKNKSILCISGDGSLQMNLQEFLTIAKYQLPIKLVILNNGYLGMVRQWQEMFYNGRYSSVEITAPDFVKLAEAYGLRAKRARNLTESEELLKEAFSDLRPYIMEFDVSEEENVFPIVPPGKNNTDALFNKN
ncbi:biosynthetic-type acetolactate synthase large subunit [Bacillus benzoevorans]|uniref:Acetolactate synthase n=1 Tax=Bacillus benzoevorans TaxID=1456 RepID=A0A7X0HQY1_9BACI|nr:biosynthetic-type acetolactate synthase large subunit [Bacillus benzoevorans]MBB6445248.1 acetolactate synthase-1/2/3 large subunit [Bacillus benzoevorans]